jgi:hypothetical protein
VIATVQWVAAGFIAWTSWRACKLLENARGSRDPVRKGLFYGEALFHVAVIVMIYALLWSPWRS